MISALHADIASAYPVCPDSPDLSLPETNDELPIEKLLSDRRERAGKAGQAPVVPPWQAFSSEHPVYLASTTPKKPGPAAGKRTGAVSPDARTGAKSPGTCKDIKTQERASRPGTADVQKREAVASPLAKGKSARRRRRSTGGLAGKPKAGLVFEKQLAAGEDQAVKGPTQAQGLCQKLADAHHDPYRQALVI